MNRESSYFRKWMRISLAPFLFVGVVFCPRIHADTIWPEQRWEQASPESQGMSGEKLDAAAHYALSAGGGSGCVIRGGYLVKEWGDPQKRADIKSCTKGSLGATALGLALDRNLVDWDDPANAHYRALGRGVKANTETGWLDEITVGQLATMTAGFDDGRPPRLAYRPGTSGIYSNDTANMLAELLTIKFNEDLYAFMKREVMDPIGVSPSDWKWRNNSYRKDSVQGIKSREFASGLRITHRALARIGYLYLRQGRWKDRQILKPETIEKLVEPTSLPAPWDYYAVYWGSNQRGTFPDIPGDTYWAMGLGDSILIVCPSLDIVTVRLGTGSRKSMLPGSPNDKAWDEWGVRVAHFFKRVVEAVDTPYPPSSVITGVCWAPTSEILRLAKGSDNWPLTWADDGDLYTAYGDGFGFKPFVAKKLSMGFARVSGDPPKVRGENIRSESGEHLGDGAQGKKASGMLMVDGTLYMWVRNAGNAQLAWSKDHGQTWTWSDWTFKKSFGCPTFLNFGKNYRGARDRFVYLYSQDMDSAYEPADRMVMARVHRSRITERKAYRFFKGLDPGGKPVWTRDVAERGAVFHHFQGCYRSGITYNAGLQRYLWCQTLPGDSPRFAGGFGIYDAPEPWGPWTTVFFSEKWDVGPGETSSLPTKWMSQDGLRAHLVFSGDDFFSVRQVTFTAAKEVRQARTTRISIKNDKWLINGKLTYPCTEAEGLLMNLRAVNATFEDRNRPDFDADENTHRFLQALPDYIAHGMRAFTLNLQGGMPGYEGAVNSAFNADGTLRPEYLQRIERVIDACDRQGCAVILGCYYQRQDQILQDEEAVRRGVMNTAQWIASQGFTNVLLEISNEFNHRGFDHAILKSPTGQVELIKLAQETVPGLLVSTSGLGDGRIPDAIAQAADFILPHYNGTKLADIPKRIQSLKPFGKPIVCNEDDKTGSAAARAAELSVANGASWGYMNKEVNQYQPFQFDGRRDDVFLYDTLRRLTAP
ncbi:MAG: serine hydrolase [Planctomycetes bacterium]|nr:serine hydrolase [Planctomycetota bacterium]